MLLFGSEYLMVFVIAAHMNLGLSPPLSFMSVSVSKTAKRFIEDVSLEQGIASQSGVSSLYAIGGTSIES